MMVPEPLRSAMVSDVGEDTSLALPSDNSLSTGQQRVLNQVHTIKRSKFKQSKIISPPASTGMAQQTSTTSSDFGTFKFSPSKVNGTFSPTNSSISTGFSKGVNSQRSRTISGKAGRNFSSSGTWDQQVNNHTKSQKSNGLKHSRSDPALAPPVSLPPAPSMRVKGQIPQGQTTSQAQINRLATSSMVNDVFMTNTLRSPSFHSQQDGKLGTLKSLKMEQRSIVYPPTGMADITLKEAVDFLSSPEESYQHRGASFIQHTTFKEPDTKTEVLQLGGIPGLVTLLRSPNPGVSQVAAGALRNLVFNNKKNKLEVQHCDGIAKALQLLKETDSTESQKQITGLLWNLSSAEELKKELTTTAMPVLTEHVVKPFTLLSDSSTITYVDPAVFNCATGCLRNLSCGEEQERNSMRSCKGLIDSLISYIRSCVAEGNPDDLSVENCTCILHNLTFQLEDEYPESFSHYQLSEAQQEAKKSSTVGCFSPRSSKAQKEIIYDMEKAPAADSEVSGVQWLCHPKAVEAYLSLLSSSEKDATLEASCGALQNLTAGRKGSSAVSGVLLEKLKSAFVLPSLLKSPNKNLQKTTLSLLDNLSRNKSSQVSMARQVLPHLSSLLSSESTDTGISDDIVATACSTARRLVLADNELNKKVISTDLVNFLMDLSSNESLPKASKEASLLLYSMWNEKNLQSIVKKLGFKKAAFVNETTIKAHHSVVYIE
ncbi:plakophilin-1 isoform X1 [Oryzias melastigma]|uniref:plakophilin-1 isoform X1 n=1 Tax=Oryzias melastigma TaxID=30732 RepID=UPI000CF7EF7C|nr:plakophilin-1 isoform X1 [Oryzias melastigma]